MGTAQVLPVGLFRENLAVTVIFSGTSTRISHLFLSRRDIDQWEKILSMNPDYYHMGVRWQPVVKNAAEKLSAAESSDSSVTSYARVETILLHAKASVQASP